MTRRMSSENSDGRRRLAPRRLCMAIVAALAGAAAHAGTSFGLDGFSLDGFGTFSAVHSDYKLADFVSNSTFKQNGAGYSRSWVFDQDTKLGLQAAYQVTDKLSLIVQGISERRPDNSFRPKLEWANIKYDVTPELSVRAGRVLTPSFIASETQNVGYSSLWMRTPSEIFIVLPTTNLDGVSLTYRKSYGPVTNQVQLQYGSNKADVTNHNVFENTGIQVLADTVEYGDLTVHFGYQRMGYTYSADPTNRQQSTFDLQEVGFLYDPGKWYVTGESVNGQDSGVGNTKSWYLGGGVRFGHFTVYGRQAAVYQSSNGDLVQAFGPQPLFTQRSWSTGVRWDFMTNLDLKVQYDRVTLGSPALPVSFTNVQPGARVGDKANVVGVALDFVW